MRNRESPFSWPSGIPRTERILLDVKGGSFCRQRRVSSFGVLDRHAVNLECLLLVSVDSGSLLFSFDGGHMLIDAGEIAVLCPGTFLLTENAGSGLCEYTAFYLTRKGIGNLGKVLEDILLTIDTLNIEAEGIAGGNLGKLNRPLSHVFRMYNKPWPQSFRLIAKALTARFHMTWIAAIKQFYQNHQDEFNRFLDQHTLDANLKSETLAKAYPKGEREFKKGLRTYANRSTQGWLNKRRMQLAHLWISRGERSVSEVAEALGYTDFQEFQRVFLNHHRVSPFNLKRQRDSKEANLLTLREEIRPFWRGTFLPNPLQHMIPEEKSPVDLDKRAVNTESIGPLWDLKSTGLELYEQLKNVPVLTS